MTPAQVRLIIREELARQHSDRVIFQKDLQLLDGRKIQVGKGTGTIIATEATQKLGFWAHAPVVQPAAPAETSAAIIAALKTIGIFAA